MPKVPKGYLEARRNDITDAAMTCFVRKGFHQTTMKDICKEAELSPGAVYRYFAGKNEIMGAVISRNTEQWAQLFDLAEKMAPEPGKALELVGRYFFSRFHDPGFELAARVDIETWPESLRDPKLRAAARDQMRTMRTLLADLVRPEAPPGVDPEALINMYMALYMGLQLNKILDPEGVDTDAVLEVLHRVQFPDSHPQSQPFSAEPLPLRQPKEEKEA